MRNCRFLRLRNYDYSGAGAYFITVCVWKRLCLFGNAVNGEMVLNQFGTIVWDEWLKTAQIRNNIEMDSFVVMPNHVHGVVLIAVPLQPGIH
jgi:REP element-mobilizing transposase RayT